MKRLATCLWLALFMGLMVAPDATCGQGPTGLQARELHGQVDQAAGTPFRAGALVKVQDNRGGMAAQVTKDSRGKFDVVPLQKSRYTVIVHASRLRDASSDVDLDTVPRAYVRITLHELCPSTPAATSPIVPPAIVSVNDLNVPEAAQAEF